MVRDYEAQYYITERTTKCGGKRNSNALIR